jgi:Ca-activated chloride channel family protein
MFRFEHPELFWFLLLPAGYLLLGWIRNFFIRRDWQSWGSESSNVRILSSLPRPRYHWLTLTGLLLLCIAVVNPQWGYKKVEVETKSASLYLMLDISNSMLAEDIAPSRLERAKRLAIDISTAFRTDRVGLILFAGNAYIQSPLTTDWHAIQLFLNAANPDQAGTQGTAIGEAVKLALRSRSSDETSGHGAFIILTDGEDHDGDAPAAIEEAFDAGWVTYIVGVGTEAGATIPVVIEGNKDVKRDDKGQPVKTALNGTLLKELADIGKGKYYDLNQSAPITGDLKKELATLERSQLEKRSFSEHISYFQWFLLAGLMLILTGSIIRYKFDLV